MREVVQAACADAPTVYTLWNNPGIVPLLYTPSFVIEKLQGGADLMTPGLQRGPPFPKKATKGMYDQALWRSRAAFKHRR